jgi:hypothetical protein
MMRVFIFTFSGIFSFFLSPQSICFGQKEYHAKSIINDSIVHREMDYFTIAGASQNKDNSDMGIILKEIPLTYSGDSVVVFEKADWYSVHWAFYISFEPFDILNHSITYSKDSIILAIDDHSCYGISNRLPKRQVSRIDFFHEKYRVRIPENAFDGIYEVPIYYCKTKKDRKKPQHFFKAYLSNDKRRKYLYMLNGEGKDRYEVTWVMDGYDYYGRFINKVPEK